MHRILSTVLIRFIVLAFITGVVYPILVWGMGTVVWPWQAQGSLLVKQGVIQASYHIGQYFQDPRYFYGRPSATADKPYNALASGGSNWSQYNDDLLNVIRERKVALCQVDDCSRVEPPRELLEASASGLDPDIGIAAAQFQVQRIARVRGLDAEQVEKLIDNYKQKPFLSYYGTTRVNVVILNLELDRISR